MAKQLAHVAVVLSMFAAVTTQARQDQATPDPKFTVAMQKGEAALKARRFEEAIDAFKQANAMQKKTSAAAFYGLGRAYQGLGAFKSGAESCAEGLKHVGCENCHGPGNLHASNPGNKAYHTMLSPWKIQPKERLKGAPLNQNMALLLRIDKVCQGCHDIPNDPTFNFEKKWPNIAH